MRITICSSMKFIDKIREVEKSLIEMGHEVLLPIMEDYGSRVDIEHADAKIKFNLIREHFSKIDNSDAILVLNFDKNNIKNYIGGNSFLEMGKAFDSSKKIFLLNPIPKINYTDEIVALQPIILNGNLELIK